MSHTVIELPELSGIAHASSPRLLELLAAYEAARRTVLAGEARLAGEIARRSSVDLGYGGLAQSTGDRTPDALLSRVAGISGPEARQLVTVGRLLDAPSPWYTDVASEVDAGSLSVGGAAALTAGLGEPSATVSPDALLDAAQSLLVETAGLPPERVARRSREKRDELDAAGVASREAELREKRFLRLTPMPDGLTRVFGMLDPESAALVTDAIDCVTAPRRGGPRFVDPDELARILKLEKDPRTTEQIAVDALVDMVRIAGAADEGRVFGVRKPAVRVHVDARDLTSGTGAATLEGQPAAVSISTAERLRCDGGYQPIVFQPDGAVDVGRAQRLFTNRQRVALAAVWGGCAVETCDRPPSWTEAHHTDPWAHGGATDTENGVLLCRHHHMFVHNNGWTIHRDGPPHRGRWRMTAPPGSRTGGGSGDEIRLVPKNPIRRRHIERELART